MTQLQNYKFRIKDADQSKRLQEVLFKLGYNWAEEQVPEVQWVNKPHIYAYGWSTPTLLHSDYEDYFERHDNLAQDTESFIESQTEYLAHCEDNMKAAAAKHDAPFKGLEDAYDEIVSNPWYDNEGAVPNIDNSVKVDVKFRNGKVEENCAVDGWDWSLDDNFVGFDILQWRFHNPNDSMFYEQAPKANEALVKSFDKYHPNSDYYEATRESLEAVSKSIANMQSETDTVLVTDKPIKSDGGSSSYYKLLIKTKHGNFECETGDVIAAMVGNDFCLGNAVKALRRIYEASQGRGKEGVDAEYDYNKILFFVRDFIERSKL